MTWFKVDDHLSDHRKTRKAGTAAMGLWVLCGSWSAAHLTDGWVPRWVALRYGSARQADKLVTADLWVAGEYDGETGWWFHEWTEHQPTKEQVISQRAYNTRKTALHRDPQLIKAVRSRDGDRCRYCGVLVNWTDRKGGTGATYDHVEPTGPNTIDNIVVACRACNSSKSGRDPAQAGMELLTPGAMGKQPKDAGKGATYLDNNQVGSSPNPVTDLAPDPTRPDPKDKDKGVARKRASRIPENFTISADMRQWAAEKARGFDLDAEHENFIDYWTAKAGKDATKADWVATWRTWMRRQASQPQQRRPTGSTSDQRVMQAQALKQQMRLAEAPQIGGAA